MTGDPSIAGLVLDSPFSDLKAGSSGVGRIHLCIRIHAAVTYHKVGRKCES